jgi:hypothetical protein
MAFLDFAAAYFVMRNRPFCLQLMTHLPSTPVSRCGFHQLERTVMNLWMGIAMLAISLMLIVLGRPDRNGVHRRFLRFNAALVLYPPVILVFVALGAAAVIDAIA